ncbi:MAG TPA: YraN family protein [Jatrophihabitans sp.]|jgi:putative endonuclease|nr:YraN family protein [Jatrophihabitans sp.]
MRVKDAVGRYGEQLAAQRLEADGLVVLARNWRCRDGELDLVARDGDELVFVEVKTRSSAAFGDPAEAVDRVKAARIRQLARQWIAAERERHPDAGWSSVRFDVVSVLRSRSGPPRVTVLRGAF